MKAASALAMVVLLVLGLTGCGQDQVSEKDMVESQKQIDKANGAVPPEKAQTEGRG